MDPGFPEAAWPDSTRPPAELLAGDRQVGLEAEVVGWHVRMRRPEQVPEAPVCRSASVQEPGLPSVCTVLIEEKEE